MDDILKESELLDAITALFIGPARGYYLGPEFYFCHAVPRGVFAFDALRPAFFIG